jgi:hypothetical protein
MASALAGVDLAEKYRKGELTLDVQREEQLLESEQKIAALERKVGQLTMELDLLKKGLAAAPSQNNGSSWIIFGPGASPSRGCRMIGLARSTYYCAARTRAAAPHSTPRSVPFSIAIDTPAL